MENNKKAVKPSVFKRIIHSQYIIPLSAILALAIFNLIYDASYFEIAFKLNSSGHHVLSGNLISVLDYGSELAILAIGMTLVTAATGGQDISVGATTAICGAVIMKIACGGATSVSVAQNSILIAFLLAIVVGMLCGAFNGFLVSVFRIQPMVATLILFTAARSIAAWINHNQILTVKGGSFMYYGNYIPGIPIPTPILIAAICVIIIMLVLKFTTLGLYTQSVGINEKSSRLNGLNPTFIKFITFVILGVCVAVVALIKVSRIGTINNTQIAKDIEMDAILAVALGGNSLAGGKFSMMASVLGAYVIQFLTSTLYRVKVPPESLPAYKAIVVIILVVLSSPVVREKLNKLSTKKQAGKKVAQ